MTPKPTELLRAAALPLTNVSILFALLMFWLLLGLVAAAGMLGVWLAIVIVPALFRYFTNLVETVGRGLKVAPLGAEFFRWVGDWWSLFPAVVVILIAWASYTIHLSAGATATTVFIVIMGTIYPAMLAVLSVTHSPMHSINPVAIFNMLRSIGATYAIAPLYLGVIVYVSTLLQPLPFMAEFAIELLLLRRCADAGLRLDQPRQSRRWFQTPVRMDWQRSADTRCMGLVFFPHAGMGKQATWPVLRATLCS